MMDKPTRFSVTLLDWDDFLQILLMRKGWRWDMLWRSTDLILGGLNLASDYLCVIHNEILYNSYHNPSRNPELPFKMKPGDSKIYLESMSTLGQHVSIWPAPSECIITTQKLETQRILQYSAISLDLQHLLVIPVEPQDLNTVVNSILSGEREGVLKREYSGFSKHVITEHTKNSEEILQNSLEEDQRYQNDGLFPRTTWFLQPFLPHLIRLGELRTYIVDGAIFYTVSTTPVDFDPALTQYIAAEIIRPLETFWLVGYPPESLVYSTFFFSFFAAIILTNQPIPMSPVG
jgi:hypothetical protein